MKRAFLFFFLLISFQVFGQEIDLILDQIDDIPQLSKEQLAFLKNELTVQEILVKGMARLDESAVEQINLDQTTKYLREVMDQAIDEKLKYASEASNIVDTNQRRIISENVKNAFDQNKFKRSIGFFSSKISELLTTGKSALRINGIRAGFVYVIGSIINWGLPVILIAQKQYLLANAVIAAPVASITTGAYLYIEKIAKKFQFKKLLGGDEIYQEIIKFNKTVKRELNLSKKNLPFLIDGGENKNLLLSIEDQNFISKIKVKLGYNNELNLSNLKKLIDENNLSDEFIEEILRNEDADFVKTYKIVNYMNKLEDKKAMEIVLDRFSKNINEVAKLPKFSQARTWALKAASSKTFEELYSYMARIPTDIPPKMVADLWYDFILPQSTKNIEFSFMTNYNGFRNLYNDQSIKAKLQNSSSFYFNEELQDDFTEYFKKSVPQTKSCELDFVVLKNIGQVY